MSDDQTRHPSAARKIWPRWSSWLGNVLLILVVFAGVHWWKARPLAEGMAPPLSGLALDGRPLDLASYRGRTVLVHFWASWCPVCKAMDGAIDGLAEGHPVLTVAMQSGGPGELRRYMEEAGLDFPVIPDVYGQIAGDWGVAGVPATFVVDATGRIRFATVGLSTQPGLRARMWAAERAD